MGPAGRKTPASSVVFQLLRGNPKNRAHRTAGKALAGRVDWLSSRPPLPSVTCYGLKPDSHGRHVVAAIPAHRQSGALAERVAGRPRLGAVPGGTHRFLH